MLHLWKRMLIVSALFLSTPTWSQNCTLENDIRQDWAFDWDVISHAVDSSRLYMMGGFNYLGKYTGSMTVWTDATTKDYSKNWPVINGSTGRSSTKVLPDGQGGYILYGNFSKVGDSVRHGLAHIDSNGQVLPLKITYPSNFNYYSGYSVWDAALSGDTLYFVGPFDSINNQKRPWLAAISISTNTLLPLAITSLIESNPTSPSVQCVRVHDSLIYVCGQFSQINGVSRPALAAFNKNTFQIDSFKLNILETSTQMYTYLKVDRMFFIQDTLLISGLFHKVQDSLRSNIAYIPLHNLSPKPNLRYLNSYGDMLHQARLIGDTLYLIGQFDGIGNFNPTIVNPNGSISAENFAAIKLGVDTFLSFTYKPDHIIVDGAFYDLDVKGNELYLGGQFTQLYNYANSTTYYRSGYAVFDKNTFQLLPVKRDFVGSLWNVKWHNGKLFLAGEIASDSAIFRKNLACIDLEKNELTTWDPTDFRDHTNWGYPNEFRTLAVDHSNVYIGGKYKYTNGSNTRSHLVAIDKNTGTTNLTMNPLPDSTVYTLAVKDSFLYVGGRFKYMNSLYSAGLAAYNTKSNQLVSWFSPSAGIGNIISKIAVNDSNVFVAGNFSQMGAFSLNKLALIDRMSGITLPWNPNPSGPPAWDLKIDKDRLYLMGDFTQFAGVQRTDFVAYHQNAINDVDSMKIPVTGNQSGAYNTVLDALLKNGRLYTCGYFTSINSLPRLYFAELDTMNYAPTSWIPIAKEFRSLFEYKNKLYGFGKRAVLGADSANFGPPALFAFNSRFSFYSLSAYDAPRENPLVTIQSDTNGLCVGQALQFQASCNIVGQKVFHWYVNNQLVTATDSSYFSYSPQQNDLVYCVIDSKYPGCTTVPNDTSNFITCTVTQPVVPTCTISGVTTEYAGLNVTMSSTTSLSGVPYLIHWYANGVLLGTSSNTNFTFVKSNITDTITAELIAQQGCYDTAWSNQHIIFVTPNGISNMDGDSGAPVIYYQGGFIRSSIPLKSIEIYSMDGKQLYEKHVATLSTNFNLDMDLPAGIYLLKALSGDNQSFLVKFNTTK